MNKKGFTLIELLAVIIILGILMIIAIPSVTKYINDSRKSSYIDTAKELIGAARNVVNEGNLEMYDTDATYYIDIACLKTENGGKAVSPYGEFVKEKAYVVVTFDGKGYEYFWTSIDESGQGVKNLIRFDKLDTDNIESDLKTDDIKIDRGIDGRSKVVLVTERNHCQKEGAIGANGQVNSATGEEKDPVIYPEGKDKSTVAVGDIVKIKDEEFYVVSNNIENLVLITRYNLNVGNYKINNEPEGIQSPNVKGWGTGVIPFASTNYWSGSATVFPSDVYGVGSNLKQYVDNYVEYLKINIKEARLLKYSEAINLNCSYSNYSCENAPSFLTNTSYWLGSANSNYSIWAIEDTGYFNYYGAYNNPYPHFGVRPVIVI